MRADAGGIANRAARLPPSGGALGRESAKAAPAASMIVHMVVRMFFSLLRFPYGQASRCSCEWASAQSTSSCARTCISCRVSFAARGSYGER